MKTLILAAIRCSLIFIAVTASLVSIQPAQAARIVGEIGLVGGAKFDTTNFPDATQVVEWSDFPNIGFTSVGYTTGDFSGIPLFTEAAMSAPWTFNPSTASPGLWSVGGFTFDLLSSTITLQSTDELIITGTGIVRGNGFDPTPATWLFAAVAGPVRWVQSGGNRRGYIEITDEVLGGVTYFVAPAKFHGHYGSAYGTNPTFDLRQSYTGPPNQFDDSDVILVGGGFNA